MRLRIELVCALAAAGIACRPGAADVSLIARGSEAEAAPRSDPWLDPSFHRAESDEALVAWRPVGNEIPKNRHFELEVWVVRDGRPVGGAELLVRADMPAHGHGMNVEPRALRRPDGSFLVKGLLLHMAGEWVLALHVNEPGRFHSATFPIVVE